MKRDTDDFSQEISRMYLSFFIKTWDKQRSSFSIVAISSCFPDKRAQSLYYWPIKKLHHHSNT